MLLTLIKSLTFKRTWNFFKTVSSYYISRILRKPLIWGMPYAISIEASSICQLACPECQTGLGLLKRNIKLIPKELFVSIINQLSPYLFHLQLNFQGESFVHPDIIEFIKYARSKKILVSISTHALRIDEALAKQIVESNLTNLLVSIDGLDEDSYKKYRINGSLSKALKTVEIISEVKTGSKTRFPKLIMQFIVFRHNEHQLSVLKSFSKEHLFDKINIKTAQFVDFENGNENLPTIDKYNRYKQNIKGGYSIKSKLKNHCYLSWSRMIINSDGLVCPCCYDKNASHSFGNINNADLYSIWKGNASLSFKQKILKQRKVIRICCNCTEGLAL